MLDHLVYATPDLDGTVAQLRGRGLPLSPGGQHAGRGTRNFLAGLGGARYLEVIGPDPEQPEPAEPRPFGIDLLTSARLVTWAARVTSLPNALVRAGAAGYELLGPVPMSRRRPDGVVLEWELAFPPDGDGVVPFLIDWHGSPHPAESLDHGVRLESLRAVHPDPGLIARRLAAVGQELDVERGDQPGLEAVVSGDVVLR
ncbi:VOC family protein [Amycolatopsis pithecellobii]|uniref:VOC family protein n=1 Tax=Amycolatopsis pithecellobii TaxID=664692 RepID=A0A6N7Z7Z4_9PSEU|nr:VOC family protein [Amycolatopsis pithecellobii]MTD57400.1 VOC family protein [Amycolatopsis pithecellobii]